MTNLPPVPENKREYGGNIQIMERFPDFVRERAYMIWASPLANQKMQAVVDVLLAANYGGELGLDPDEVQPITISVRTLFNWSKGTQEHEAWAVRYGRAMQDAHPGIFHQVTSGIVLASIEAKNFLSDLVREDSPIPMTTRVEVDAARVRANAANSILDRAGHLAYTRPKEGGALPAPKNDYTREIADMSMDDLRAKVAEQFKATSHGLDDETMEPDSEPVIDVG